MIHYFNPGHETAVLNASPYYTAPSNVLLMQRELAFLPAWYASSGDCVLVEDSVDREFYDYIRQNLNLDIESVLKKELHKYDNQTVAMWGISPQSIHFFEEINKRFELSLKLPTWHNEFIYLNSRMFASDCLKTLCGNISSISKTIIPQFCSSLDEVELCMRKNGGRMLAKAPYSSSGRGLLWLPESGLTRTENQILQGMFNKQGKVSIERVLDKQVDFAMEFMSDGKGAISFVGYSLFETNSKGAYEGNIICAQDVIKQHLYSRLSSSLLETVKELLIDVLSQKYGKLYRGCIGVDMLIYNNNGECSLHPCLEINMRSNMGLLSLSLAGRYVAVGSQGRFKLEFSAKDGAIYAKHKEREKNIPAVFENGRLLKGYLPLCPISNNNRYATYLLVNDRDSKNVFF